MTGWELVAVAQERIGAFWTLTQSQVYRELASMAVGRRAAAGRGAGLAVGAIAVGIAVVGHLLLVRASADRRGGVRTQDRRGGRLKGPPAACPTRRGAGR